MKNKIQTKLITSLCAALVVLSSAWPQSTRALAKDNPVIFGGYLDFYYQYDFGRPRTDLNDRLFDVKHNDPTLTEADFDIVKAPSARVPFGFTVQLLAGRSTELMHSTEPGGLKPYEYLGQGYITYMAHARMPLTIDFGQFYTWIGYESYDSRTQDNYSRSFENTLAQPDYHLGARLTYPISPKLNGNLYLVEGWNEDVESHNGKSWGATLAYSPSQNLTLTCQNYSGLEGSDRLNDAGSYGGVGFPSPGVRHVNLLDFIATYQPRPDLRFAFDGDYASAAGAAGGHWDGETVYVKKQLGSLAFGTLRLERVSDTDGLRTGSPVKLYSATLTYETTYKNFKHLNSVFELRHDWADSPTFASDSGSKRERTTLTISELLHF